MRKYFYFIFAVFIAVLFVTYNSMNISKAASPDDAQKKSFIWKVQSDKATVYVFGATGIMKNTVFPLSEPVMKAFEESPNLAIMFDTKKIDPQTVQKKGMYPSYTSLEKYLNKENLDIVKDLCSKAKAPYEQIKQMRPWAIVRIVRMVGYNSIGYNGEYNIETYLLKKGASKKLYELSTYDENIKNVDDICKELSNEFFTTQMAAVDYEVENYKKIVDMWKAGDTAKYSAFMSVAYKDCQEARAKIVKKNAPYNAKLGGKIEEMLKTDQKYFVIFPVGYLLGNGGILEYLQSKNYKIEQL